MAASDARGSAGNGGLFTSQNAQAVIMNHSHPLSLDEGRTQRGGHGTVCKYAHEYWPLRYAFPAAEVGGKGLCLDMLTNPTTKQVIAFFNFLRMRVDEQHKSDIAKKSDELDEFESKLSQGGAGQRSGSMPVGEQRPQLQEDRDNAMDAKQFEEAQREHDRKNPENKGNDPRSRLKAARDLIETRKKRPSVVMYLETCMLSSCERKRVPSEDEKMGIDDHANQPLGNDPEIKVEDENNVAYIRVGIDVHDPEGGTEKEKFAAQDKDGKVCEVTRTHRKGRILSLVLSKYFEACEKEDRKQQRENPKGNSKGSKKSGGAREDPFTSKIRTPAQFINWCSSLSGKSGFEEEAAFGIPIDDDSNPLCLMEVFSIDRWLKFGSRRIMEQQCDPKCYTEGNFPYRHLVFIPRILDPTSIFRDILPWKKIGVKAIQSHAFRNESEIKMNDMKDIDILKYTWLKRLHDGNPRISDEDQRQDLKCLEVYLGLKDDRDGKFHEEQVRQWVLSACGTAASLGHVLSEEERESAQAEAEADIDTMKRKGAEVFDEALSAYVDMHQPVKMAHVDMRTNRSFDDLRRSMGAAEMDMEKNLNARFKREGMSPAQQKVERAKAKKALRLSMIGDFIRITDPSQRDMDVSPFQLSVHMQIAQYLAQNKTFNKRRHLMFKDGNAFDEAFSFLRNNLNNGLFLVHTHDCVILALLATMYVYSGDAFGFNIFLYGEPGCGKSFVVETLREFLIPGTYYKLEAETDRVMSAGGNMDDMVWLQDEVSPEKLQGKDGKSGNAQAALKSRLSSGVAQNLMLFTPPDRPREMVLTETKCKTVIIWPMNLNPWRQVEAAIRARVAILKMSLAPDQGDSIIEKAAISQLGDSHKPYHGKIKEIIEHWQMLAYLIFKLIYCGFLDPINCDVMTDLLLRILKKGNAAGLTGSRDIRHCHRVQCLMRSIVVFRVIDHVFRAYPLFDDNVPFDIRDLLKLQPYLVANEQDLYMALDQLRFQYIDPEFEDLRKTLAAHVFQKSEVECMACGGDDRQTPLKGCTDHSRFSHKYAERKDEVKDGRVFIKRNPAFFDVKWSDLGWVEEHPPRQPKNVDPDATLARGLANISGVRKEDVEHTIKRLKDMQINGRAKPKDRKEEKEEKKKPRSAKEFAVDSWRPGDDELINFGNDDNGNAEPKRADCLVVRSEGFKVSAVWVWSTGLDSVYDDSIAEVYNYNHQNPEINYLCAGGRPITETEAADFSIWGYRRFEPDPKLELTIKNHFRIKEFSQMMIDADAGPDPTFNPRNVFREEKEWKINQNASVHAINQTMDKLQLSMSELELLKRTCPIYPEDEKAYRDAHWRAPSAKWAYFRSTKSEAELTDADKEAKENDRFMVKYKRVDPRPAKPPRVPERDSIAATAAVLMQPDVKMEDVAEAVAPELKVEVSGGGGGGAQASDFIPYRPEGKDPRVWDDMRNRRQASEGPSAKRQKTQPTQRAVDRSVELEDTRMGTAGAPAARAAPAAAPPPPAPLRRASEWDENSRDAFPAQSPQAPDGKTPSPPRAQRTAPAQQPAQPDTPQALERPASSWPRPMRFEGVAALLKKAGANVGTMSDVEAQRRAKRNREELEKLQREQEARERELQNGVPSPVRFDDMDVTE